MPFESINPATGETIGRFDSDTPDVLEQKLEKSRQAFRLWRNSSLSRRSDLLQSISAVLRRNHAEYSRLISEEMGKPIRQARAEVEKCAWVCNYYADNGEQMLEKRFIATDGGNSYVRYDPLGPVFAIMPWNFPFWQLFRFAAPALIAGNSALLKHASNVPGSAQAIESIFLEAGIPDGLFQTLMIDAKTATNIIADKRIVAVTLTGSERAGEAVAGAAGKALKKSLLELGGSDPFIVLADADLEQAARHAATSRTLNSGQSCIAAKRFIVHQSIAQEFTTKFERELASLRIGDPLDEQTDVGPLARDDLRRELHDLVERSIAAGARCRLGGTIPEGPGFFYPVTLLDQVTAEMAAAAEETFGPVAVVLEADDDDHAIELANQTPFGLGASIWTSDSSYAEELCHRIDAGAVFINGIVKSDPRLPFGGVKLSGYGRELSVEGVREFINIKTVWVA